MSQEGMELCREEGVLGSDNEGVAAHGRTSWTPILMLKMTVQLSWSQGSSHPI